MEFGGDKKMSTVFVLLENHFFRTPDNRIWCDRVISYKFLQRYLQTFNNLVLCGRLKDITANNARGMNLVSGKGVTFVGLPDFAGALGTLKNSLKIKKIIKNELKDVDCAIVRVPSPLSLATYSVFKKSRKPFAIEFVMAADKMFDSDKLPYKILNKILVKRAQKMCLAADGVAYVTEYTLQKKYPCRKTAFTTNYSSIDLRPDFFYQQNWDIKNPPECFNIVHIGYMDSNRKGQDILIDAVRKMVDDGRTNIHVVLIGDGKMRNALEKKVIDLGLEKYIKFVGAINDKSKIRDILIKNHLFVFPSRSEGLPRVVIEAMAVGLVCIASPTDGTPEIVNKKFLVTQYSGADYAKKIITTINDWPCMIDESRKNNIRAKDFQIDILNSRRKEFYDKLEAIITDNIGGVK